MSEMQKESYNECVRFDEQRVSVRKWWNGDIEVHIYNIPELEFQSIAAITGCAIHEYEGTSWIKFAKARDKTQVTLFRD